MKFNNVEEVLQAYVDKLREKGYIPANISEVYENEFHARARGENRSSYNRDESGMSHFPFYYDHHARSINDDVMEGTRWTKKDIADNAFVVPFADTMVIIRYRQDVNRFGESSLYVSFSDARAKRTFATLTNHLFEQVEIENNIARAAAELKQDDVRSLEEVLRSACWRLHHDIIRHVEGAGYSNILSSSGSSSGDGVYQHEDGRVVRWEVNPKNFSVGGEDKQLLRKLNKIAKDYNEAKSAYEQELMAKKLKGEL